MTELLERPRPAVLRGGRLLVVLLAMYVLAVALFPELRFNNVDLYVYLVAGDWLWAGESLYDQRIAASLPFNYPPIAALLFSPLSAMPEVLAIGVVQALNIALAPMVVWRVLRYLGRPVDGRLLVLAAAGSVFMMFLDSVAVSADLGQINLVLLALVVFDVLRTSDSRWRGVGIGLAGAIKLTPLLFVPYLLITRQFRAAGVATGTFLGAIALGFLIAPSSSAAYWSGSVMSDLTRITPGGVSISGNMSLNGFLLNSGLSDGTAHTLWLLGSLACVLVTLALAAMAHRRDNAVLGVALVGLCTSLVSPFTWGHHWVFCALITVYLLHHWRRPGHLLTLAVFTLLTLRWARFGLSWRDFGPSADRLHDYLLPLLVVLAMPLMWLYLRRSAPVTADQPSEPAPVGMISADRAAGRR
ncbi:DUF2029 domain-containing protein [Pseudonocardiaceae bacterium YIM PH 21723]|nr:DUF2029 domain-containing protein [Pseudonocardiaceae bacterium YIM PH 21723]